MKKSFLKFLFLLLPLSLSSLMGCNKKSFNYNYDNFYGICALTGDYSNGVDKGLTNDWTRRNLKAMHFKSMRVWISPYDLFSVDSNDEITVSSGYYQVMKDHIDKCAEAGVVSFDALYTAFIYPADYSHTDGYCVPDPIDDPDMYVRFLNLMGKASAKIKELFPQFDIFEPGNEPDGKGDFCIHKDGFHGSAGIQANERFVFNDEVKASIICDICYYVRKYVREVDPTTKVSIPGLTNYETNPDFIDNLYNQIESHRLPMGTNYSDTNPDHYFDYLNWHPYSQNNITSGELDDAWVEIQKRVYQVAIDHGDEGKPVLFSEIGWTTFNTTGEREEEQSENIGHLFVKGVEKIRKYLPWVECVYYFRLTNTHFQQYGVNSTGGERSFGMFYHPNDPDHHGAPRKSAYIIAKLINGQDYDLDAHLEEYLSPYDD